MGILDKFRLDGKLAVVTGSSQGMGLEMARALAEAGCDIINFSLALLNLLPIPVLDGGHVLFALIEFVTRRRIPVRVAQVVQTACAVLIVSFMLYITFFDVKRVARVWRLFHADDTEQTDAAPGTADGAPTSGADAAPP